MTVTVNREVFLHPDFMQDLSQKLCDYLNALIDAELEKEDADFDFIDECACAINAIREGFVDAVLPVISRKEFMARLGIKTNRVSKSFAAVVAAAIMLVAGNSAIAGATDYNIIEEVAQKIADFISNSEEETTLPPQTEPTTKPVQTTVLHQKEEDITIEFEEGFKTEYNVGEQLNTNGLKVYLLYDDGSKKELEVQSCKIAASPSFGKAAGYETVTVSYGEFEQSFKVRILNTESTPLLTSIYATFPEGYDFTADDLNNIDLSFMQVYAVYSDGDKTELAADEYTIEKDYEKSFFEEKVTITIVYKNCSCSFMIFKK
ncbi:MAG: bacterial Ig-like domain-containing protein [Clostridia bacterium]|nr:bacterial Ig-like domain-containing protein [Clostridia bacterium]